MSQNVQESIRIDKDSTLTFDKHIHETCEKTSQKICIALDSIIKSIPLMEKL